MLIPVNISVYVHVAIKYLQFIHTKFVCTNVGQMFLLLTIIFTDKCIHKQTTIILIFGWRFLILTLYSLVWRAMYEQIQQLLLFYTSENLVCRII